VKVLLPGVLRDLPPLLLPAIIDLDLVIDVLKACILPTCLIIYSLLLF